MKKITSTLVFILGCVTLNLSAQCYDNLPILETFNDSNVINVCWNTIDGDGDTYSWQSWEFSEQNGGHKVIASYSFDTLTPDNWVVSNAIDLTSYSPGENITLSWKVRGELSYAAHEKYTVYAATNNQTTSFESSLVKRSEYTDAIGGAGVFVPRSLDVSSLAGNTIYVAFRHHETTNQGAINIDEISITALAGGALSTDDFNKENFNFFYSKDSKALSVKSSNNPLSSIKIYNILGQSVVNKKLYGYNESLNLSSLVDGLYIAQIEIDNTIKSIKFLKR